MMLNHCSGVAVDTGIVRRIVRTVVTFWYKTSFVVSMVSTRPLGFSRVCAHFVFHHITSLSQTTLSERSPICLDIRRVCHAHVTGFHFVMPNFTLNTCFTHREKIARENKNITTSTKTAGLYPQYFFYVIARRKSKKFW